MFVYEVHLRSKNILFSVINYTTKQDTRWKLGGLFLPQLDIIKIVADKCLQQMFFCCFTPTLWHRLKECICHIYKITQNNIWLRHY